MKSNSAYSQTILQVISLSCFCLFNIPYWFCIFTTLPSYIPIRRLSIGSFTVRMYQQRKEQFSIPIGSNCFEHVLVTL